MWQRDLVRLHYVDVRPRDFSGSVWTVLLEINVREKISMTS